MFSNILGFGARFDEELGPGPMVNMDLGIAFINMMVRGTWFVNSKKAEVDIGLSFMYPIHRMKSF